jgi:hypothetical protein
MTPQYLIERLKFIAQGTHGDTPLFRLRSPQRSTPTTTNDKSRFYRNATEFRDGEYVYPADILEMFRFLEGEE